MLLQRAKLPLIKPPKVLEVGVLLYTIQRSLASASVVLMALAPALLMKLPVAASTMLPLAWLLVIDAPASNVMLPLVNKVALSANATAPPTVMLPALLLPMVMPLKPSATTREPPPNNPDPSDSVPLPVPKPMLVPAVKGSMANAPVPAMRLVAAGSNRTVLARSVTAPLCVTESPNALVVAAPSITMPSLLAFRPAVPMRVKAPEADFTVEPPDTLIPSLLVPEPLLPPPVPVRVTVALPVPVMVEPDTSTP